MNSLRLFNDHGVKLRLAADQSIPNTTVTKLSWDVVEFQRGSIYSGANPTRLTAPVTGKYRVITNIEWKSNSTGERTSGVTLSAGGVRMDFQSQGSINGGGNLSGTGLIFLNGGEYLEVHVYQSSGGSIKVHGGAKDRTSVVMWLAGV